MSVTINKKVIRVFRSEYKFDTSTLIKDSNKKELAPGVIYIRFCGDNSGDDLSIKVGDNRRLENSSKYMEYLCSNKNTYDNEKMYNSVMRHLVADIVSAILKKTFDNFDIEDYIECESGEDVKIIKREVRKMIHEFVGIHRENRIRSTFMERVRLLNTQDRFRSINTNEKTFAYFVVPKDGDTTTKDVKNMILVKSDPRNGYDNIIARTVSAIRSGHSDFDIFKKDPNIQLTKSLSENIIPYV